MIKRRMKENTLTTKEFACGPGTIVSKAHDSWDDYEDEETSFNFDYADSLEDFIDGEFNTDLASYYDGEGIDSIIFAGVMSIRRKYYLVWRVTFDNEAVSEEEIKEFLTGQMSDGWGENLEQHIFAESSSSEDGDEEEDYSYGDREEAKDLYYFPWNPDNFEVVTLG